MIKKMRNKKGVSEVVATILLILIGIIAIGIISYIILPFVRNVLKPQSVCVDTLDKIKIKEESCYTSTSTEVRIEMGDIDLKEIRVVLNLDDGTSIPYALIDGSTTPGVGVIEFPEKGGGEKTYTFNKKATSVDIYPVLQDKKCDIGKDSLQLSICS